MPRHPHTALATVSWLFTGEIEHRDSTGAHAMVRPGELNLMTAGRGVSHSEFSTPDTSVLHGVQLWVATPAADRGADVRVVEPGRGGASLHVNGIDPGFANDVLPLVMTSLSRRIDHIRVGEIADYSVYHQGETMRRLFGFGQPMDTLRDKHVLEEMWRGHQAPWKVW